MFKKLFYNFKHKIEFWKPGSLKNIMLKYGLPFMIILIVWELIEDLVLPFLYYQLGTHIHPIFFSLIPFTLVICLHPIVVPILWFIWTKFKINGSG